MRFSSVLMGLVLALAPLSVGAQSSNLDRMERILADKVLRVGTSMDTAGFSMRDATTGELSGFDIDMLESLAAALGGVKVEYVKMTFPEAVTDLRADKFDIAMSGMGRQLARARLATFSRPYFTFGKLPMIRSADKEKYKVLADLDKPGIRIGSNSGGPNEQVANTQFENATAVAFPSNEAAFNALLEGKIEAQITDSTSAMYLERTNPRVAALDPKVIYLPVTAGIMVRREDQTLLNFINIWLDQAELDGTLARTRAKWLGEAN